jgi:hypothetical protein
LEEISKQQVYGYAAWNSRKSIVTRLMIGHRLRFRGFIGIRTPGHSDQISVSPVLCGSIQHAGRVIRSLKACDHLDPFEILIQTVGSLIYAKNQFQKYCCFSRCPLNAAGAQPV